MIIIAPNIRAIVNKWQQKIITQGLTKYLNSFTRSDKIIIKKNLIIFKLFLLKIT